ncbi:MAG: hypothetical protein ACRDFB_00670 [Rhabdochlamydiaceae bacterium]
MNIPSLGGLSLCEISVFFLGYRCNVLTDDLTQLPPHFKKLGSSIGYE